MIPIRPINEELHRLHQPSLVVEDDSLDAFQGFSVTSMISRPQYTSTHQRRSSDPPLNHPSMMVSAGPPSYHRYHHNLHHHQHRRGRSQSRSPPTGAGTVAGYPHQVVYPVKTTTTIDPATGYYKPLPNNQYYRHSHQQHHHHHLHAAPLYYQQEHHVRPMTIYGSPGTIPRVSW